MIKRFLGLLLALLLLAAYALAEQETYFIFDSVEAAPIAATGMNLYVDPALGDDSEDGAPDTPLRTIAEALYRAAQHPADESTTIWLHGGEYLLTAPLDIAGDTMNGLSIRAYPGETPIITGSQRVEGFVETSYMGGLVWAVPVSRQSIRTLYGQEGALQNARWPKEGSLLVARAEKTSADKREGHNGFYAAVGEVPASLDGAMLRLLHWWKDEMSGVRSYDPVTGYVATNRLSSMSIVKGDRYWFENVLSITLAPGEWAYDAQNAMLYYAPQAGEEIADTPIYLPVTEQLLRVQGVSSFTLDGITFSRTGWSIPNNDAQADFQQAAYDAVSAIEIVGARDIRITGCTFKDMGAGCVRLGEGVQDAVIYSCSFESIGAQALYIHGINLPYEGYVTERILIENNEISGYGKNFMNAAAVLIIHARNIDIMHNEIHGGTYTGISAGWVWGDEYNITDSVRIHNNLIYGIGQGVLSDMGAIYLLGRQPNSFVSNNVIHDVSSHDYGGWGIYLDEGSSGIIVENNLVYRCSAQGFHQHNGVDNVVRNNIFALSLDGQIGGSGTGKFLLEKNIIIGAKPHINKEAAVTITTRDNIYREDASAFVNAQQHNYNLVDDPSLRENGFIPWVYFAGRYASLY